MSRDPFAAMCVAAGLPEPTPEYRFHPVRKWRADYGWPAHKLLLEVEGLGGRHQFMSGFIKDCEKYTEAALCGYRVLRVTTKHMKNGTVFDLLRRAFAGDAGG